MTAGRSDRKKSVALVIVGMVLGAVLITPAGAHISSVSHTWKKHFAPLAKKLFYTKKQSDSKYLTKTGKAADANKLDGMDGDDVLPGGILPSGATIRGHYANFGRADGANFVPTGQGISFGYRLASAPTVEKVFGSISTVNCPGTADAPEAAPGYFCIYEKDSQNKRHATDYPSVSFGSAGGIAAPTGADISTQSSNSATGFFWSRGTWAVTAP